MLTSNPRKTLSLYWPRWQMIPLAIFLAMLLHPVVNWLAIGIQILYPVSDNMRQVIEQALAPLREQPLWLVLLMVAVTPAICEEIAFRGFILSGLRHSGHRWAAIAISSVFFGITHGLLQQSISAVCVGLVIGYLVMHSGSLLPGILFHMTNNALMVIVPGQLSKWLESSPWLGSIVREEQAALRYHPLFAIICALAAAGMCYWLSRQPYQKFAEERLQQALDHQSPLPSARPQWRLW
jgi:sodium transport system permease protein